MASSGLYPNTLSSLPSIIIRTGTPLGLGLPMALASGTDKRRKEARTWTVAQRQSSEQVPRHASSQFHGKRQQRQRDDGVDAVDETRVTWAADRMLLRREDVVERGVRKCWAMSWCPS